MAAYSLSIVNNTNYSGNYTIFQKSPQTAEGASVAWTTRLPSMSTSVDWSQSYTFNDAPVSGAQMPATIKPPLQQNAGGTYAYDISGNSQTWETTDGTTLYL